MNKLKIINISATFPRPLYPSLGTFIYEYAKSLEAAGAFVKMVCPVRVILPKELVFSPWKISAWKRWLKLIKTNSITEKYHAVNYYYYTSPPYPIFRAFSGIFAWITFRKKLIKISRDVNIIISHFVFESGLIALLLSRNMKKPYIIFIHENFKIQYKNVLFCEQIMKYIISKSILIFVNSELTKKQVLSNYPEIGEKVKIIPLPVNNLFYREIDVNHLVKKKYEIVAVSHLVIHKNLDIVIQAFHKFCENNSKQNIILEIYGDGQEKESLQSLINKLNFNEKVYLKGALAHEGIAESLKNKDIFVQVGSHETFGLAIAEAMLSGLYPIVSEVSGIVEDFRKLGGDILTVPVRNTDALINAISLSINIIQNKRDILLKNQRIIKNYYSSRNSAEISAKYIKNKLVP